MGMILTLTSLAFLLMVQVACYHAISASPGTSSGIILKSGEEGALQCGFKGKAQAVYWTYQSSSSKQLLLIKLDMLQQIGERRVYGYKEGRYNISEDFSLIIHDVTDEDEGRYTCKVLESITCSLLSNYTFVSVAGMHSEVILKSGEDGTLTCDIKGEAHVVYWTYQGASSKPVLLVRLELFQHQVGQRRIALNTDGRYNITGNFSLIISDVTLADEGRYTCEILELTGSIVSQHSDVSVPGVKTVPRVLLESGKKAKLTCGYKRTVYAVYWRYESTTSPMELLVVLDGYDQVGERSGPGYDEGRFDITDDYSLVIHNVEAKNEGRYTCEVSDFKSGLLLRNHTDVHTIVTAERPFVRIEQCEDEVSADDINAPCVFHATSDVPSIELTCTVLGAKPMVELAWISSKSYNMSKYWELVMNASTLTTREQGNGIFDQTLTVYVDTSFFTSDIQHFTCVAEGLAVDGKAILTISVYLAQGVNVKMTVISSILCILLFTTAMMGVVWNVSLRDKWGSRNAALRKKVIEIKGMNADEPVYLGVLGDNGAGKSSFIASLKYFIQDPNESIREEPTEGDDAENSVQISELWQCTEFISTGLRIRKMRDERKFKPEEISTILKSVGEHEKDIPSSGHRIKMESSDLIHLPIFVFDISNEVDLDNRIELLNELSSKVFSHIREYPMLVLTKAIARTYKKELKELMKKIYIPRGNILVTFHYLDSGVKSGKLIRAEILDFILKCIAKVDKQKRTKLRLRTWWKRRRYMPVPLSKDTVV